MIRLSLALGLLCPMSFGHDVWVVDAGGQGDFLQIQGAVDAAASGDTILVKAGTYSSALSLGKGLQLVAERNHYVRIVSVGFADTSALEDLYIAGIDGRLGFGSGWLEFTRGRVLIEDCRNVHGFSTPSDLVLGGQFSSFVIVGCRRVGQPGAPGGDGEDGSPAMVHGGSAVRAVFVYDSSFSGGYGGDGYGWTCQPGGRGGPGIQMNGGILRSQRIGAYGGAGGPGCWDGNAGMPMELEDGARHVPITAPWSRLSVPNVVREGEVIQVTVAGEPGTAVDLLSSPGQAVRYLGDQTGALLIAQPWTTTVLGTIPPSGVLAFPMPISDLPPGEEGEMTYHQAVLTGPAGQTYFSNPTGMVVLDASF